MILVFLTATVTVFVMVWTDDHWMRTNQRQETVDVAFETNVFGDLDCDGDYDIDDARLAMTTFGIEEAEGHLRDVDGDGSIGFSDVLVILNDWGSCP